MSREDRIISKLEGAYDFIEYVNDNYPQVLIQWKSKAQGLTTSPAPTDDTVTTSEVQSRNDQV